MQTQQEYWTQSLNYGMSNEEKALNYLKEHYNHTIDTISRNYYNKKDNSQNKLYGDITMLTKTGQEVNYEVKSRKKDTKDLTWEIYYRDGEIHLKTKYVHYYIILLPDKVPLIIDYMVFEQLFYDELRDIGQVSNNTFGGEPVIFIPIKKFLESYNKFMGYNEYLN